MKKFFISADIEGTCGIAHWDETSRDKADYAYFSQQMTREVAAACEGLNAAADAEEIFVKDAHDSARNVQPDLLPENVRIFRGWGRDPWAMMSGIDESFDGVVFTGYHSAVSWDGNPLSHTMNTQNIAVKVNGEIASELMLNSLTASLCGVPVLMVTGDAMLCRWMNKACPATLTVPVNEGRGNGCISMQPAKAVRLIRETAEKAAKLDPRACLFPMPEHFTVEVSYRQHQSARGNSFYPGAKQIDSRTIVYESDKWFDCLTFLHFCL